MALPEGSVVIQLELVGDAQGMNEAERSIGRAFIQAGGWLGERSGYNAIKPPKTGSGVQFVASGFSLVEHQGWLLNKIRSEVVARGLTHSVTYPSMEGVYFYRRGDPNWDIRANLGLGSN